MLTQRQVVPYLLQRQLVRTASIVEGDLVVLDASRRNRNFKVMSERGPSYLLKQGVGPERVATVAREAAVYQLVQSDAGHGGLGRYLPRYYGYDPDEHILIVELLRDAENLREHHARRGRFSPRLAAAIGQALGTLHRLPRVERERAEDRPWFLDQPPWALSVHRPDLRILRNMSRASIQLIKVIQQCRDFCELLDALRQGWRPETLIHCDIKWDNCLIFARSPSRRKTGLKLVDWELARVGDPCWDVGSVFHDYLSFWLLSIPIMGEAPPDRLMELSRYPLGKMHLAIGSFWQSYVQRMALDVAASERWLQRAVQYGAARLVQTGLEQMQAATQLTGNMVCLLQLSLNMLRYPLEAVVTLLGIPLSSMRVS